MDSAQPTAALAQNVEDGVLDSVRGDPHRSATLPRGPSEELIVVAATQQKLFRKFDPVTCR
jgi:hypothetical protein